MFLFRFSLIIISGAVCTFATMADVVISEFMASNNGTLLDEDGDTSDWIEIRNTGISPVSLAGWKLSDDSDNPNKWQFPSVNLGAGQYLVVFASGKDRRVSGQELHTNFSLSKSGEYLALIRDNGTPSTQFVPNYPPQHSGVSYGVSFPSNDLVLITEDAPCKARVPNASYHAQVGNTWRGNSATFDESSWTSGTQGVGYERSNGFQGDINLDVENMMYSHNTSVYVRIPFSLPTSPSNVVSLKLRMKFDDGFASFVNGQASSQGRAFSPTLLTWNSTTEGGNSTESQATTFLDFDVSDVIPSLTQGSNNILAIQGLNSSPTSSDLLFRAELVARVQMPGQATTGFFTSPTPSQANSNTVVDGFLTDTTFEYGRGIYHATVNEIVRCQDVGATLIYTTDGSVPSPTNGTQVAAPDAQTAPQFQLSISTTTVLRVIAVKENYEPTNVDTQTYLFPQHVISQTGAGLPLPSTSTSTWDYEMDPAVVNDPRYPNLATDLLSHPILSIVLPNDDVWGNNGVYANPRSRGSAWERACSVEVINPDGSSGYQVEGGLRIHGSGSRTRAIGKKSMRLAFRKDYGSSRFKYPLWGLTGPDEVSNIILRGSYFDSWTFQSDSSSQDSIARSNALQFRTHFATAAFAQTGNHTVASNWCHLYINGQYWGIYNTHERPDEEFAAYHYGGDEGDYSVIKTNVEVVAGSRSKWDELMALCNPYNANNHQAILNRVDEVKFIDYILMNIWGGNADWPHNNWYAIRNDTTNSKFVFYVWDPENYVYLPNNDRSTVSNNHTPGIIYDRLRRNDEFKVRFGDRAHKFMFNDGTYAVPNIKQFWQNLADELEPAMNCESARWGDEHTSNPYNTIDHYLPQVAYRKASYFNHRHNLVLTQLRNIGLYPLVNAPSFSQHGGYVAGSFQLSMTNPNTSGEIYYTIDGTDPRLPGGVLSPSAQTYISPFALNGVTTVKARARTENGEWSALNEAVFTPGLAPSLSNLVVSEIHYHPADASPSEVSAGYTDKDDFEFIELMNIGGTTIDLSGLEIVGGIGFDFSTLTDKLLGPGERLILAKNADAFAHRYGSSVEISGTYSGRLNNDGETIVFAYNGDILFSVSYNDAFPWPDSADGQGASLVLINPTSSPNHSVSDNWRPSSQIHGSPTSAEALPIFPPQPNIDSNGNGLVDLLDYALTVPPVAQIVSEHLSITYTCNPAAEKVRVVPQYSDSLSAWSGAHTDIELTSEVFNLDGTVTYHWRATRPVGVSNRQFLRLRVLER